MIKIVLEGRIICRIEENILQKFELAVVKEYVNEDKSKVQICEEYSIHPSMSDEQRNTRN